MNTVKQGVGLNHESRHQLDLIVENEKVGVLVRVTVIKGSGANVRILSADRHGLPEIGLQSAEPTSIAIPSLGLYCNITPSWEIPVLDQSKAPNRDWLPNTIYCAGLHAQALEPGEVPNQHIGSSDP